MNHCCKWRHQSHLNLEEDTYIVVNRWKTLTYFMGVFQRRQDVSRTTQQKMSAGGQGDRGKPNDQQTDFFGGGVPSRKTEKHVEGEVQG